MESKALMLLLYMQGYKISFLKELYRKGQRQLQILHRSAQFFKQQN